MSCLLDTPYPSPPSPPTPKTLPPNWPGTRPPKTWKPTRPEAHRSRALLENSPHAVTGPTNREEQQAEHTPP